MQKKRMIAPYAPPDSICLGEVGTMHVWFASEGNPRGVDITADAGEFLCLPGDTCGCDGSLWWDLLGTIEGGHWVWNGEGQPLACDAKRVVRIIAYL